MASSLMFIISLLSFLHFMYVYIFIILSLLTVLPFFLCIPLIPFFYLCSRFFLSFVYVCPPYPHSLFALLHLCYCFLSASSLLFALRYLCDSFLSYYYYLCYDPVLLMYSSLLRLLSLLLCIHVITFSLIHLLSLLFCLYVRLFLSYSPPLVARLPLVYVFLYSYYSRVAILSFCCLFIRPSSLGALLH